jgi:hypothetical protein
MDARYDEIELTQNFVRKIESAVFQNVAFDPGKNLEVAAKTLIQFLDLSHLLQELFLFQTVSLKRTLAMVSDA